MIIVHITVLIFLLIALYTDIRWRIIPNKCNAIFFIVSWLLLIGLYGTSQLVAGLLGLAAGFIPMFIIYVLKGIGAGDVKWFATAGICLGVNSILELIFYAILYAGVIGCVILIFRKTICSKLQQIIQWIVISSGTDHLRLKPAWLQWAKSGTSFPFMIAVLPAFITMVLR